MGVFPIAMNILQFWLLDSIVKFQATFVGVNARLEDQEPLVNGQFDEDDFDRPSEGPSSIDVERRPRRSFSSQSFTLPRRSVTKSRRREDEVASSVLTSTSSKTIIPIRRSPPPSPSQVVTPSSSYGSIGGDGAMRSSRERWRSVEDDDVEHAKWSQGLGFERGEFPSAAGAAGDTGRPRSKSPTSRKQWESWHMPKISLLKKNEPFR
jgi:hypothetical protein